MKPHALRLAMALVGVVAPAAVSAQHESHQAAAPQPSAHLAQCAQVQPAVENIVAAAMARLEAARQANDPAQMRAAVDYLQGALRDLRTQLAPCAAAGIAADPHPGHAMPKTPPSSEPPAAKDTAPKPSAVTDPHAGHKTAAAKPARPKTAKPKPPPDAHAGHGTTPPKAAPPKTSKPSPADPHAAHRPDASAKPADKQMDPVTGLMVDPAKAPKTTYQGQTYYFSSEASKKEFLENPAKFARKPKR